LLTLAAAGLWRYENLVPDVLSVLPGETEVLPKGEGAPSKNLVPKYSLAKEAESPGRGVLEVLVKRGPDRLMYGLLCTTSMLTSARHEDTCCLSVPSGRVVAETGGASRLPPTAEAVPRRTRYTYLNEAFSPQTDHNQEISHV
jgi:hypothetical protein